MFGKSKFNRTSFGIVRNPILNLSSEGIVRYDMPVPNILNSFSVDSMIVTALSSIGLPIWNSVKENENENDYDESEMYFVFNYSTYGVGYADDEPCGEVSLIQVHLFAPLATNLTRLIRLSKAAIHKAGFTWPETVNASDEKGRHIVFEFQYVDGVDFDGDIYV